ncbi:hypothetical protein BD311DRAFT_812620 [Dichomitus squalens]|uniref:Uncharacterized protein n=1 Tax=Dichomitus squalens TaxID=114155 RepID=A0A4Q9M2W9_9APHY|nr:hypothetical protein BD311DRAFT_812620 [Dichomitus squalens]
MIARCILCGPASSLGEDFWALIEVDKVSRHGGIGFELVVQEAPMHLMSEVLVAKKTIRAHRSQVGAAPKLFEPLSSS